MRILALETRRDAFRQKFTLSGEKVLLSTGFHPKMFVQSIVLKTIMMAVFWTVFLVALSRGFEPVLSFWLLMGWSVYYVFSLINAFICYRYSFLFLTTEKVVYVYFTSVFSSETNPTHLENIASTEMQSQFLGLFRCGILYLNLRERSKYSTRRLEFPYVPDVAAVAGAIENTIVLNKERAHGSVKKEAVQKKISSITKNFVDEEA